MVSFGLACQQANLVPMLALIVHENLRGTIISLGLLVHVLFVFTMREEHWQEADNNNYLSKADNLENISIGCACTALIVTSLLWSWDMFSHR